MCCAASVSLFGLFRSIETATQRTSFLGIRCVKFAFPCVINPSQRRLSLKSENVLRVVVILQRRYHCFLVFGPGQISVDVFVDVFVDGLVDVFVVVPVVVSVAYVQSDTLDVPVFL